MFATPRAAEFLELRALQAQTGQPAGAFGDVVIKELLDNALDAAESTGRAPAITITTREGDDVTYITVTDNGDGIAPATVDHICDFNVLVSDKAKYRGPARGAQGNALKTLLGIPYAFDITKPVVIESAGVRHELQVTVDRCGDVVVTHETTGSGRTAGTSVTVPLPGPDHLDADASWWAWRTALVNPHATITVVDHAYSGSGDDTTVYKPSDVVWSKWTPSAPSSPHWYDATAFTALVHSHIHSARNGHPDKPLGEFIREFDGLSGTSKAKAVRAAAPDVTHLSGLDGRDDLIAALHATMIEHAKPTPANRLGPVGEDHYRRMLHDTYGVNRFWYRNGSATVNGVPWIIEVAVADTDEPGDTWFAFNHAPAFGDPLGRTYLPASDINTFGAASFLAAAYANNTSSGGNRAAVVHIICAAPQFVDKGKVALVVPKAVAETAAKTLDAATKTLRREAEQRRKDAVKAERAHQQAIKAERENLWSIKDAVFEVLAEAKASAGDVCAARTLFYKVRPLLQNYTDKELGYAYFSQTLLPEYERTVAPLPGLYYEPRGELHHPHDDDVIPLGTREVEAYTPPPWQFDKVLYVEKKGLAAQLAPYRLGERYDMAVIFGQGYAPTACRNLLARSDVRDMKLFVVHDADPSGYDIARTLAEATRRMPDHTIDVIDLGLTVPQAIAHGLETEKFTRKKELPADLELDAAALEWFTGTPTSAGYGSFHHECRRCELNAFSADQLAEFIEAGLQSAGATTKLVPPAEVLDGYVRAVRDETLTELVWAELAGMVDVDAVVRQLIDNHPELADAREARVRESFTGDPYQSWRSATEHLVRDDINAADDLDGSVRALLAEQLAAPAGDSETGDDA
ncbi:ATP-binding protein [Candidatus Mycolicibacterium alkanivorans]|uniref:ATP-binding protein n=1 Tax=Candidatus Mycolicibacterium alkanivorans TaxID=2954114 RepID=A0ABS9YU77_9MYCO|nr:ATP-binding protein [Candidatus Mycolicibacterium alkanivorans]MCI4674786.1 ATP-binding protein [Candidatus Mycolicibacterium alkanivorans]